MTDIPDEWVEKAARVIEDPDAPYFVSHGAGRQIARAVLEAVWDAATDFRHPAWQRGWHARGLVRDDAEAKVERVRVLMVEAVHTYHLVHVSDLRKALEGGDDGPQTEGEAHEA